jgi:hypothetical protein
MKEWASVPIGSPWDTMKPTVWALTRPPSKPTGDNTGVSMALKSDGFGGLGKRRGEIVRVCWTGNRRVKERGLVSKSQACGGGMWEQR